MDAEQFVSANDSIIPVDTFGRPTITYVVLGAGGNFISTEKIEYNNS